MSKMCTRLRLVAKLFVFAGVFLSVPVGAHDDEHVGGDGASMAAAIPVPLGGSVRAIGDSKLFPGGIFFRSHVPANVDALFKVTMDNSGAMLYFLLVSPNAQFDPPRSDGILRWVGPNMGKSEIRYSTPIEGDYCLWVKPSGTGERLTVEVKALGVPPAELPLVESNCFVAPVTAMKCSIWSVPFRLAHEVELGGTRLCAKCNLKPPVLPGLAEKLESSLGKLVKVCLSRAE